MSEEEKDLLVSCLEKQLLGEEVLKPGATKEEIDYFIQENFWGDEAEQITEEIQNILNDGDSIYQARFDVETTSEYLDLHRKLLEEIKKIPTMKVINEQLDY